MYRSSPFRSTLNTGYIKLWTCVALDQCKSWTPFGHFCPYFHTPYTLLCPKDEFTFTFRRGLIWKIDNPSTTLSLAPGIFDNPYKGAESAGCQKQHRFPKDKLKLKKMYGRFFLVFKGKPRQLEICFQPSPNKKIDGGDLERTKDDLLLFMSQLGKGWHLSFCTTRQVLPCEGERKGMVNAEIMILLQGGPKKQW